MKWTIPTFDFYLIMILLLENQIMEHKITSKELVFVVVLKHQNRPGVSKNDILAALRELAGTPFLEEL